MSRSCDWSHGAVTTPLLLLRLSKRVSTALVDTCGHPKQHLGMGAAPSTALVDVQNTPAHTLPCCPAQPSRSCWEKFLRVPQSKSCSGKTRFSAALHRVSPPLHLLWAGDAEAAPSGPWHAALSHCPKYQQVLPYFLQHTTPTPQKNPAPTPSLLQHPACLSCKLSEPSWTSASPHLRVFGSLRVLASCLALCLGLWGTCVRSKVCREHGELADALLLCCNPTGKTQLLGKTRRVAGEGCTVWDGGGNILPLYCQIPGL